MKVTTQRQAPLWEPRSITITFETQEELDALYQLANNGPIGDACKFLLAIDPFGESVVDALKSLGAKTKLDPFGFTEKLKENL